MRLCRPQAGVMVFINATSFAELESLIQHQATSPIHWGAGLGYMMIFCDGRSGWNIETT